MLVPASTSSGGGKANSFADAYQKARSTITILASEDGSLNWMPLVIPKESLSSTAKPFCTGAYYDNTYRIYFYVSVTNSAVSSYLFAKNGTTISNPSIEYYYD